MANLLKLRELCNVLGFNLLQRIREEVDQSIVDIDAWLSSDLREETTNRLNKSVEKLIDLRLERFAEIQRLGLAILSRWDILSVPFEEKKDFINLVCYIDLVSADEITEENALSLEFINKVEQEYHRVNGQLNVLVEKKKSKLEQIFKNTHFSRFSHKDTSDPMAALLEIRTQISEAKVLASQRAKIVTQIELIQHAAEEVKWYEASQKDGIPQDARSVKARLLEKALPKMVSKLEVELADWGVPFIFDGLDAGVILERKKTEAISDTGTKKTTGMEDKAGSSSTKKAFKEDKAGTSVEIEEDQTIGAEATAMEDMQIEHEQEVLPFSLPSHPTALRTALRTPRVPPVQVQVQAVPQAHSPPDSSPSDESMWSSPSGSDESRSDPDDSDYDPKKDV